MPKKTNISTPVSTESIATTVSKTTPNKRATKKAVVPAPPIEVNIVPKPKVEPVQKVVAKKAQRSKFVADKKDVTSTPIVQEATSSSITTIEVKPNTQVKNRPQRNTSKKPIQKIPVDQAVAVSPIEQVKSTIETASIEKLEAQPTSPSRRPQHRNQRNNKQRHQQKNAVSIPENKEIVDPKENESIVATVVISSETTELTEQQLTEPVLPRKKNKKKKKSKAKTTETPIAVEIPVDQSIPIEVQQQKPTHKPQQKQGNQKQGQQKQQPIQKEVKKVKPRLPLNDKSKKLFSYLTPLAKDFIKKVYASLVSVIPFVEHESIMVCVSGGKDSVVLLDALWYISGMIPMKIIIAHCNHNLRGEESEQDEQFVRFLGKKYSVPIYCTSVNVSAYSKKYKQSIELAARTLRYKFFERIAKEQSIPYILTAHTKDDTVETMLFNLIRGTGIKGITGIPKKRELDQNITVYRPILPISRMEISEYADERQLEWREDSSNTNLSYTRNKIRHKLLPLLKEEFNPSVLDTLYRFVEFAKGAESLVLKNVETYLPHIITKKTNNSLTIHLESFKAVSMFLKGEILLRSIKSHFEISLTLLHIEGILQLLDKETGSRHTINEHLHVFKERNELIITNHHRYKEAPQFIQKTGKYNFGEWTLTLEKVARQSAEFTNDPYVEYLDEDTLPALLILRHWEHGDRFAPIGMFGLEQNVSDYLTNTKIAHLDRESVVVLASTTRIFWVCGHRLSESCKVTDSTINVIKATFIRRSEKK